MCCARSCAASPRPAPRFTGDASIELQHTVQPCKFVMIGLSLDMPATQVSLCTLARFRYAFPWQCSGPGPSSAIRAGGMLSACPMRECQSSKLYSLAWGARRRPKKHKQGIDNPTDRMGVPSTPRHMTPYMHGVVCATRLFRSHHASRRSRCLVMCDPSRLSGYCFALVLVFASMVAPSFSYVSSVVHWSFGNRCRLSSTFMCVLMSVSVTFEPVAAQVVVPPFWQQWW